MYTPSKRDSASDRADSFRILRFFESGGAKSDDLADRAVAQYLTFFSGHRVREATTRIEVHFTQHGVVDTVRWVRLGEPVEHYWAYLSYRDSKVSRDVLFRFKARLHREVSTRDRRRTVYFEETKFKVPDDPASYEKKLLELILNLPTVTAASVLSKWIALVSTEGASVHGLLPDSIVLALVKRMLILDFETAAQTFDDFLDPAKVPALRAGYFQLSFLGALMAYLHKKSVPEELLQWIQSKVAYLRSTRPGTVYDNKSRIAILASLLSSYILFEHNLESKANDIDSTLSECLQNLAENSEKGLLLQFISDSLAQFINEENFPNHWYKMLVLCRYLHEQNLIWPGSGLSKLLQQNILEPASRLVAR